MIFDAEVFQITVLSLQISALATGLSLFIGLPFGTMLALGKFPGRSFLLSMVNTGMGLPPVFVGLCVFILLVPAGPLGFLDMIFTQEGMIIEQHQQIVNALPETASALFRV